ARPAPVVAPHPAAALAVPQTDPWGWAVLAWAVGTLLSLAWIGAGFVSLWLLRRSSRAVTDGPAAALLAELTAALGIRRRVRLLRSERRAVPMTWGVLRPVVLLPGEADGWT